MADDVTQPSSSGEMPPEQPEGGGTAPPGEPMAADVPGDPPAPVEPVADAGVTAAEALSAAEAAMADLHESVGPSLLGEGAVGTAPGLTPAKFDLPPFGRRAGDAPTKGIDLLSDVNLNVKIELGRTRMLVEDVLKLSEGAVVELDKLAGDPVDVYVNDRHVARGEVLVLNDNFCVRINEIIAGAEGEHPADRSRA
ncbi:MAG: flagellar motor switch protein FliN [Phycisphaerales bacterium]